MLDELHADFDVVPTAGLVSDYVMYVYPIRRVH